MSRFPRYLILCLVLQWTSSLQAAPAATPSRGKQLTEIRAKAEAGDAEAQNQLGSMYNMGQGTSLDFSKSVEWFRKAADQGLPAAMYNLGAMYQAGKGVQENPIIAISLFKQAAEKEFAPAQFTLGMLYYQGRHVPKSFDEALRWFQLAARNNHPEAQRLAGVMHFQGEGTSQNYVLAFMWFSLSAEQGVAASKQLQEIARKLLGPDELTESLRRVAAFKQGNIPLALTRNPADLAGFPLEDGSMVDAMLPEGMDPRHKPLFLKANEGDMESQYRLGLVFRNGDGIPENRFLAAEWFQKASQQGHGPSQWILGSMVFTGDGAPQDAVEGLKWLHLAARRNVSEAAQTLKLIEGRTTPEQRQAAMAAADAFVPMPTPVPQPSMASVNGPTSTGTPDLSSSTPRTPSMTTGTVKSPGAQTMPVPAPVSVPVHRVTASPEAEKWYQDALVQSRGEGGRKDPFAAFDLFSKAAELGHSQAQTSLGLMLLHGNGTRPDPAKGLDWLKKSASAGDPEGMFWLGMSLPPESAYDKADWLRMSAGQGYGPAQIALANLYTAGQGVPVDFLEAYRWLVSAAAGGDSSAGPLMEFVSRFLSEADIREARRRAGTGAR